MMPRGLTQAIINASIATAKDEISTDIRCNAVPSGVKSFAELHDYRDANLYGGASLIINLCGMDDGTDILNVVHDSISAWLAAGRPEEKKS
jgi:hypothetical protein